MDDFCRNCNRRIFASSYNGSDNFRNALENLLQRTEPLWLCKDFKNFSHEVKDGRRSAKSEDERIGCSDWTVYYYNCFNPLRSN